MYLYIYPPVGIRRHRRNGWQLTGDCVIILYVLTAHIYIYTYNMRILKRESWAVEVTVRQILEEKKKTHSRVHWQLYNGIGSVDCQRAGGRRGKGTVRRPIAHPSAYPVPRPTCIIRVRNLWVLVQQPRAGTRPRGSRPACAGIIIFIHCLHYI